MTEVRRATVADAAVLARLLWDFNTEFETEVDDVDVLEVHGSPGCCRSTRSSRCWPRTTTALPVGFAFLSLRPAIWFDGPVSQLEELYVVPALRSHGIGTQVLDLSRTLVRDLGSPEMHINVDEVDVDTRRFYERHGYVNIEDGEDYRMLCYIGPTDPRLGPQPPKAATSSARLAASWSRSATALASTLTPMQAVSPQVTRQTVSAAPGSGPRTYIPCTSAPAM